MSRLRFGYHLRRRLAVVVFACSRASKVGVR